MRISVIGTGYLGTTHAGCLAEWGHEVIGIDPDAERIERLSRGDVPFHEPALAELIARQVADGSLRFSTDLAEVAGCEAHFICVGTPQAPDSEEADLTALWSVVDDLVPLLDADELVIGKSTVPVGTARRLLRRFEEAGVRAHVAWNPEFLREGQAVADSLDPDRLVFGLELPDDERVLRRIYAPLIQAGVPTVVTSLETAELAKVAANLMLATRISTVNVLAETCERAGAQMQELAEIVGLDRRIGPDVLVPGIGYGGGCLPKDSRAFARRAEELDVFGASELVDDIDRVNEHQRERAVAAAAEMLEIPPGRADDIRVGVLGAAFKADSDDVRDSPALDVARRVRRLGVRVQVYDPEAGVHLPSTAPELDVAASAVQACQGADLVLVLTDWQEFRELDPTDLAAHVRRCRVLDGRQALDARKWRAAGWEVRVLGEGAPVG